MHDNKVTMIQREDMSERSKKKEYLKDSKDNNLQLESSLRKPKSIHSQNLSILDWNNNKTEKSKVCRWSFGFTVTFSVIETLLLLSVYIPYIILEFNTIISVLITFVILVNHFLTYVLSIICIKIDTSQKDTGDILKDQTREAKELFFCKICALQVKERMKH